MKVLVVDDDRNICEMLSLYLKNKYGLKKVLHRTDDCISLIDTATYMKNCIAYILRNAVCARICAKPEDYRWTSYACYFSEIYRGGIESIPKGQYEAGQVLGMTKTQVFFKVVLLQVIKRIIPPMSNEIITLVKDTSLARTISVYEIIWNGQAFIKSDGLLWPLFYTGAFYLIFNGLLTVIFGKIEKKLDYFKS